MAPRKKDRIQNPETITSPVEEDSSLCSDVEDGSCPKSVVSKNNDNASC